MSEASLQESVSVESLVAQVADEFMARQRNGERPNIEEYAARYPQAAELLRNVLAALDVIDLSRPCAIAGMDGGEPTGTLGDFRILREVGRGGMGVVYEAEQISLGRRVALKVLPFAATMDPRHLQRFHNEARAAASLHHSNIVPVFSVGCERGVHFYAMQFIDGQSLDAFLRQRRNPTATATSEDAERTVDYRGSPEISATVDMQAKDATQPTPREGAYFRRVAEWGITAAGALEHAHGMGIVHRDVKPANLLLDDTGRLWVTDFGLARMGTEGNLTLTGDLLGTLRYMSPEQALAKHALVGYRTDVYSLGATLYELLTFRPAVEGENREELLRKIALEEPIPPRRWNKAIPVELEIIVQKAMAKELNERYASAQELADDLQRWLRGEAIQARRRSSRERLWRWVRRRPALAGLVMVSLLSTLALVAGLIGHNARLQEAAQREHQAAEHGRQQAEQALRERDQARVNYNRSLDVLSHSLRMLERKPWRDRPEVAAFRDAYRTEALRLIRHLESTARAEGGELRLARTYVCLGADLYGLGGDRAKAKECFRQAVAILDERESRGAVDSLYLNERASAHLNFGSWLVFWGEEAAAKEQFRMAVRYYQRDWELTGKARSRNNLAWFLAMCPCAELRDPIRAVELAREAAAELPREPAVANTLGAAYYRAGRLHEAHETLRKTQPLRTQVDGMDWFLLAAVCWDLGEKGEARRWHARAVKWMDENAPDHIDLRNFHREVSARLGIAEGTAAPKQEESPRKK